MRTDDATMAMMPIEKMPMSARRLLMGTLRLSKAGMGRSMILSKVKVRSQCMSHLHFVHIHSHDVGQKVDESGDDPEADRVVALEPRTLRGRVAIELAKVARCVPAVGRVLALKGGGDDSGECVDADEANCRIHKSAKGAVRRDGAVEEEDAKLHEAETYYVTHAVHPPRYERTTNRSFDHRSLVLGQCQWFLAVAYEGCILDSAADLAETFRSSRPDSS